MRASFLASLILVTIGTCAAQNSAPADPVPNNTPNPTVTTVDPQLHQKLLAELSKLKVVPGPLGVSCFTMRSYLYSAGSIGQAPQRTGYMTCTPAQSSQMRQTKPAPKAKLRPM